MIEKKNEKTEKQEKAYKAWPGKKTKVRKGERKGVDEGKQEWLCKE